MKYINICQKLLNFFHLISTFSDVLISGYPTLHILSMVDSKVKMSNFDSFRKVIFYSIPVVGQLHNFAFTEKLSKLEQVIFALWKNPQTLFFH